MFSAIDVFIGVDVDVVFLLLRALIVVGSHEKNVLSVELKLLDVS